eukprot:TRINITY_DN3113_c0_g1_i4.p1 TRINITY_DN3113_c0_g1~~TRINITY_DN3113_c0_g1_i4.p1  ORF type:complete len:631 (+),score=127.44 TRINITY_DN3113_c0_g1_i4:119-2011(+)
MIRRPPRSTHCISSAASDVYKRQVMEYANNGDLYQKIVEFQKKGQLLPEADIWHIFTSVVKGLKALHDLKIFHRDLKSANVFLNKDGNVKLGDMNVSKVAKKGLLYTQTGTPYYASPEVWKDQPYESKSDIWSLGCVLYEMTTLKPPFRAEDMEGLYKKVIRGYYPKIPPQFSQDLANVIRALLQVAPHLRPSCDKILQLPAVQKRLNESLLVEVDEQQSFLLNTIRIPKNLHYLTDRLPKPNYQPLKLRKIDKHQFLQTLACYRELSQIPQGIEEQQSQTGSSIVLPKIQHKKQSPLSIAPSLQQQQQLLMQQQQQLQSQHQPNHRDKSIKSKQSLKPIMSKNTEASQLNMEEESIHGNSVHVRDGSKQLDKSKILSNNNSLVGQNLEVEQQQQGVLKKKKKRASYKIKSKENLDNSSQGIEPPIQDKQQLQSQQQQQQQQQLHQDRVKTKNKDDSYLQDKDNSLIQYQSPKQQGNAGMKKLLNNMAQNHINDQYYESLQRQQINLIKKKKLENSPVQKYKLNSILDIDTEQKQLINRSKKLNSQHQKQISLIGEEILESRLPAINRKVQRMNSNGSLEKLPQIQGISKKLQEKEQKLKEIQKVYQMNLDIDEIKQKYKSSKKIRETKT